MDANKLWISTKQKLKGEFPKNHFDLYFEDKNVVPVDIIDNVFYLMGEKRVKHFFEVQQKDKLLETFSLLAVNINDIVVLTNEEDANRIRLNSINNKGKSEDLDTDKDKGILELANTLANSNLNPKYTFDTFVSGPNNNIALAASLSMAGLNNNLKGKNPLYLYGGVGLGKTHLMQAIGHEIIRKDPSKKVLYVTSETFTNDLIMSLKNNTPETFRQKYRSVDVLMVDDVQFFSGKNSTQEELFHTFNVLQGQNKKIIFTSDKYPKDISGLEDRLTSRFGSGAVFDIQPPEFETRVAILQKKAQDENMSVDMDIIYYIAENVKSNIRELEGALNTVSFYASIAGRKIDLDTAREALKNQIISYNTKETNILRIKETVADAYNVTVEELDSKKRSKNIAFPRQVAMYLARNLLDKSLPKIGEEFGGRDHTTVMHAIKRIEDEIEKDDMTRMRIEKITSDLNG